MSVLDFRKQMDEWLASRGGIGKFMMSSSSHKAFIEKLETLWRTKGIDARDVRNVDEMTTLSEEEWTVLWEEFQQLLKQM